MKQFIFFLICCFSCALYAQKDTVVTAQLISAKKVEDNQKLLVMLEVNRANNKGFARFTQKLPANFKVNLEDQGQAQFDLLKDGFQLVWFDMPGNPIFTVSYSILVPEKYIGDLILGGVFEYLNEDESKSIEIKPVLVKCGKFQ
jgi:hypothetical protein